MNLFASAGVDLPPSGGARRTANVRSLRTPLFNYRVVDDARKRMAFAPPDEVRHAASRYAKLLAGKDFYKQKETAARPVFIDEILVKVLGWQPLNAQGAYTLAHEFPVRSGSVDIALGQFDAAGQNNRLLAPFELKGPGDDLDAIMPGRAKSPVQQAWEYAMDAPGARWVLLSNCVEIRLYGFGRGRDAYEVFDLTRLEEEEELARLWQILSATRFLGGETEQLLRETDNAYKDITDNLYADYKSLRDKLIHFLRDSVDGPRLTWLQSIESAQKILDRILFIAFAERTDLLPEKLLNDAATTINKFAPAPLWENFRNLFRFVDVGRAQMAIPAYNGGLFAPDPLIDPIIIPDPLATELAALGEWDYRREVPVTVLGHIFEQSISDIETLKAEASGQAPPKIDKRKRDGVVYTPDSITWFLVEQTIGKTLKHGFDTLWTQHGMADVGLAEAAIEPEREIPFLKAYLALLRGLRILDPACGSGAFLVAAFDRLGEEYRRVTTRLLALGETPDFDWLDTIVTHNLYGVDLNPESVEITRLSLWLKTARRNHRLQNLDATIRCGNSLVDDSAASDRAFDWRAAFPQVMEAGGFDIVIGNPPYVRAETIAPLKPHLEKTYSVYHGQADLYAYFFELGVRLLKDGGRLGYISSSTFFRTGSGEGLRAFLTGEGVAIETLVDFGNIQVFEGVTTYPAILTLVKGEEAASSPLPAKRGEVAERQRRDAGEGEDAANAPHAAPHHSPFKKNGRSSNALCLSPKGRGEEDTKNSMIHTLTLTDKMPDELGKFFEANHTTMPRSRLTTGAWRLEGDDLAALRLKITQGRKTLGEVYGAPLYGIKTGLNEAFVIDRATRERLVRADARSAEIIKPFLKGEHVKRWRVTPPREGCYLLLVDNGLTRRLMAGEASSPLPARRGEVAERQGRDAGEGEAASITPHPALSPKGRGEAVASSLPLPVKRGEVAERQGRDAGEGEAASITPHAALSPKGRGEAVASSLPLPAKRGEVAERQGRDAGEGQGAVNAPHPTLSPQAGRGKEIVVDETKAWAAFSARYHAIAAHLAQYEAAARARTDQGEYWWELRACAYLDKFEKPKILYPDISQGSKFHFAINRYYFGNTIYFIPTEDLSLLACLNARVTWWFMFGETEALRGGEWRLRLFTENMVRIPIPALSPDQKSHLATLGEAASGAAARWQASASEVQERLFDLATGKKAKPKLTRKLEAFWELSFSEVLDEVKKSFGVDIPVKKRKEWQGYLTEHSTLIRDALVEIAAAEAAINQAVYAAFDLTDAEIALIERSLGASHAEG